MKDSLDAIVQADIKARQRIELVQKKILESNKLVEGEKSKLEAKYAQNVKKEIESFKASQDDRVKALEKQLEETLEDAEKASEYFLRENKQRLSKELFKKVINQ